MGRLEKVGAAVVGVLLCIIIVVGLLNKSEGGKEPTDASREMGLVTPTKGPNDNTKPGEDGPKNVVSLDQQLSSEKLRKQREREELERLNQKNRDAAAAKAKEAGLTEPGGETVTPPLKDDVAKTPEPSGAWPKDYVVQKNDTLGEICRAQYSDLGMVNTVLAANPGLKPRSMRSGITIKLPAPRASAAAKTSDGSAADVSNAVLASTRRPSFITPRHVQENAGGARERLVSAKGGKLYTVKRGDNLSSIAQRELGSIKHVHTIVGLNAKLLASDKTPLQVGWKLELPNLN